MKQSHVQDTTDTLVLAFSYSTRCLCACLSSSAEKRWWIYSFTFRWRKYDQGRKGPLVNKDSFFTTDQSTTLTNYIWYVYRNMCVLVYTHVQYMYESGTVQCLHKAKSKRCKSKRCRCSYVHVYRPWHHRFLNLSILCPPLYPTYTPTANPVRNVAVTIQNKAFPFASTSSPCFPISISKSDILQSSTVLVVYSWSKRFRRPSTTVLTAPWSGSLGTPHDVL